VLYQSLLFADVIPKDLKKFYFYESSSSGFYFFETKQDLKNGKYLNGVRSNYGEACKGVFTGKGYYTGKIPERKFSKKGNNKFFQKIKVTNCMPIPSLDGKEGFYANRYAFDDARGPFFDDSQGYNDELNRVLEKAKKLNDLVTLKLLSSDFTHHKVSKGASSAIDDIRKQATNRIKKNTQLIKHKYETVFSSNSVNEKNSFSVSWSENHKVDNVHYKDVITVAEYDQLIENIYRHYDNSTLQSYEEFIKNHPSAPQVKIGILKIYNIIKSEDNIAGFEWFITKYHNAAQVKEAIKRIHQLAYNKAHDLDSISAYNTFVITYPTATQVKDAEDLAYKLELKKYTDLGIIDSFFGNEDKIEKKARKLLIKAKQIERKGKDYSGDARLGYILVTNRMYDLLQEKFDDSDATLRHLESQEFKDFIQEFKHAMRRVNKRLKNISGYTREIVEVAKKGFADADADRSMAEYKLEQHQSWEKFMHFRDTGYN